MLDKVEKDNTLLPLLVYHTYTESKLVNTIVISIFERREDK